MHKFKVGDAVQTRDGRKARIVCDDVDGTDPLVAAVRLSDGTERAYVYHADGKYYHTADCPLDLIPAPRRQTVWVTVHKNPSGCMYTASSYSSPNDAMLGMGPNCTGIVRVELEEGRFDE